jgi:hypothetical protein
MILTISPRFGNGPFYLSLVPPIQSLLKYNILYGWPRSGSAARNGAPGQQIDARSEVPVRTFP